MSNPTTYEEWIAWYVEQNNGDVTYQCSEASGMMIMAWPELRRVRGFVSYETSDPMIYGFNIQHWWCETRTGQVIDPTRSQFPCELHQLRYDEFSTAKHGPEPIGKCMDCGGYVYDNDHHGFCSDKCRRATEAYLSTGTLFA